MNNTELLRITRPMDIFFTSGNSANPWTLANRVAGAGWKHAYDRDIPTHTGFITHSYGQVFCTELTEDGIEEDSAAKYLRSARRDRMIAIYRWSGFDDEDKRGHALGRLAYLRQLDCGYDWRGAIGIALPFLKHNERREYCSENVFTILKKYGWTGYPDKWNVFAPHPWPLMREITPDGINCCDFSLVKKIDW